MTKYILAVMLPLALLLAACGSGKPDSGKPFRSDAQACLAEAMYFEARGTGEVGRRAVGEVILNRAASPKFPSSICGVVDQRYNGSCQFSYRCRGSLVYSEKTELARAQATAYELLTSRGTDITNGAIFFHAASLAPGWFGTLTRLGKFGGNIFYR